MNKLLNGLLAAALTAVAIPAAAHHSFAIYDMTQNIEFDGVVETLKMRNPHMAMTLTVTNPDGTKTVWKLQTLGAGQLRQRFGPEGAVKPGQVVTVEGLQSRSGNPYGFLENLIMPDGRAVKTYFGDPNGN